MSFSEMTDHFLIANAVVQLHLALIGQCLDSSAQRELHAKGLPGELPSVVREIVVRALTQIAASEGHGTLASNPSWHEGSTRRKRRDLLADLVADLRVRGVRMIGPAASLGEASADQCTVRGGWPRYARRNQHG
jgi:hypothetical protein